MNNKHVVKVLDYYQQGDSLYVYEEYISGDTLDDHLRKKRLTETEKRDIIIQICDGLQALHSAPSPIIHRDLKPANIMITGDGIVKIVDYDIAKIYKYGQSRDTTLLGTFEYAAPEQYGFSQSDPRTDIYALGKIIEEMTTDKQLRRIAQKATKMDPKDRYKSIKEMRHEVESLGKHKLFPIPGFRRGKVGHMIVSILYWITALFFTFGSLIRNDDWPLIKYVFYGVELSIYFLLIADIFGSWTGFFDRFPFPFRRNNKALFIILGIVLFIVLTIIVRLANELMGTLVFDNL